MFADSAGSLRATDHAWDSKDCLRNPQLRLGFWPALGILLTMDPIVLEQVGKDYPGGVAGLRDFSLTVKAGEIFGFLGPNGAGKTTTIKMLLGFFPPSAGVVRVFGDDPARPESRRRLGYLPEVAQYYGFLTPRELLRFYGRVCNLPAERITRRTAELLALVGLEAAADRPMKTFSKGMQQRAGIAQALLHDPDLLILDEPMTGLDPLARAQFREVILAQRQAGKTVFFSSHELSEAEMICDRVGILKAGRLLWCGPTRDLAGDGQGNLERIFLKLITQPQPGIAGTKTNIEHSTFNIQRG
jgi:ABC-2 type transport system ATP-binding protein